MFPHDREKLVILLYPEIISFDYPPFRQRGLPTESVKTLMSDILISMLGDGLSF